MELSDIYKNLTSIFRDLFDDPDLNLTPAVTADDIEDWDSLNHIRLILEVQKVFRVKFSASEIGRLKNVGELADLIQKKTS